MPERIDSLKPIQLASFDLVEYQQGRTAFTNDEWIDFLVRSIGLEPTHFDRRLKLLFLIRLIGLCERNYNLIELGPRGTGKSYGYQELSPYAILLTGNHRRQPVLQHGVRQNRAGRHVGCRRF